jgi:hypothetical protein
VQDGGRLAVLDDAPVHHVFGDVDVVASDAAHPLDVPESLTSKRTHLVHGAATLLEKWASQPLVQDWKVVLLDVLGDPLQLLLGDGDRATALPAAIITPHGWEDVGDYGEAFLAFHYEWLAMRSRSSSAPPSSMSF